MYFIVSPLEPFKQISMGLQENLSIRFLKSLINYLSDDTIIWKTINIFFQVPASYNIDLTKDN